MRTTGKRIAALMEALQLTQADLARDMDVSRGAVWSWVHDERFPRRKHLSMLARLLGTTIGDLHGERAS